MMRGSSVLVVVMLAVLSSAHAQTSTQEQVKSEATGKSSDHEQDAQQSLLAEARLQIDEGKTADAIATTDKIIGYYESKYPDAKHRWFVARTGQETLAYMAMAAVDMDKGTDKRGASALIVAWADAYYLKGYALVELRRAEDAKVALEHAIHLSPFNSQYLSELANIYQDEKNWPKAFDLYNEAEAFATFSPLDRERLDTARAKRGQGYVLVELRRLDEAEAKYKECLAMDANDTKAQHELEYIRTIRANSK